MKRVMCVYLPKWPLQRLLHDEPALRGKPAALVTRRTQRPEIVLCSARAAQTGVRPGMPVAEAVAMERSLIVRELDPERDRQALEQLAAWLERYSPIVALEEGDTLQSLLLDITGCAPIFHGESRLLHKAVHELHEQGWIARVAIADTVGAAWGLAHYSGQWSVVSGQCSGVSYSPTTDHRPLTTLPVAALRLPEEILEALATLGINRIAQLADLPRASIPARFGDLVLRRLDQFFGRLPEVIVPFRSPPDMQATYHFEFSTDRLKALRYGMGKTIERIQAMLESRRWGARHIEWCLHYETAPPLRRDLTLFRPSRSAEHIRMLLDTQLERTPIAEPVRAVSLRVTVAEPLHDDQTEFVAEQAVDENSLSRLIDRLCSHLGREAITSPVLVPDPQPEYACRFEPVTLLPSPLGGEGLEVKGNLQDCQFSIFNFQFSISNLSSRPLRLWWQPLPVEVLSVVPEGPPVRIRWAGTLYVVTRAWGPERIETGWWRGCDVERDYYVAATHVGTRLWLFRRRGDGRWGLQGCFE